MDKNLESVLVEIFDHLDDEIQRFRMFPSYVREEHYAPVMDELTMAQRQLTNLLLSGLSDDTIRFRADLTLRTSVIILRFEGVDEWVRESLISGMAALRYGPKVQAEAQAKSLA